MGRYKGRGGYGGYRRYRTRSYGRGSGAPVVAFVALFVVGVVMTAGKLLVLLIPFVIFGGVVYGIYRLFSRDSTSKSVDTTELNFQKHTERVFFTGTNNGEALVANTLAYGLDHEKYYIFNNVTIPSEYNGSSQIDHIVVSHLGIFVIETKDYKGWIFGGKDQKEWTQSLPGGNKFHFFNPLRQNWSHIQSLKEIFPTIPEEKFISVVVFTDASEFKSQLPENVVNRDALVSYIMKFQEQIIHEDTIYAVVGKLTYRAHTNNISEVKHLENLNNLHPTLE